MNDAKVSATEARRPCLKVVKDERGTDLVPDHPSRIAGLALIGKALALEDYFLCSEYLSQLYESLGKKVDTQSLNFMIAVVEGIKPRDHIEAMLAAQMAAIHIATMRSAGRLANSETIAQRDSAERAFNKLARTFAAHMEALKRYRTGNEQKVTVQHVTVSEGGQAIVGHVTQRSRETTPEQSARSPAALAHSQSVPMAPVGSPARSRVPKKGVSGK